eukprot:scaffold10253_cov124-Isochrysis_galbana.AAC.17
MATAVNCWHCGGASTVVVLGAQRMGQVIFTIFAGRKRFLSILWMYVRQLLSNQEVDSVHVWDYCRNAADRDFLRTSLLPPPPTRDERIQLMEPPPEPNATLGNRWRSYYAFYAKHLSPDDILIKADDDVVALFGLPALLREVRRDSPRRLLVYPSIVNNDVCAVFQAADGVLRHPHYGVRLTASAPADGPALRKPISDWYTCSSCARYVHSLFLAEPARFFTGCVHEWRLPARVSINFFAVKGETAISLFKRFVDEPHHYIDEPYLTAFATELTALPSAIVTDTVAVHYAFGAQHEMHEPEAQRDLLHRYRALARNGSFHEDLRRRFGDRTLSCACPAMPPPEMLQGFRELRPPEPSTQAGRRSRTYSPMDMPWNENEERPGGRRPAGASK